MYKYKLYCIWFYFNQRNTFSKVNKNFIKKNKKRKNFYYYILYCIVFLLLHTSYPFLYSTKNINKKY